MIYNVIWPGYQMALRIWNMFVSGLKEGKSQKGD